MLFALAAVGMTAVAGGVAAAPHLLRREPTAGELAGLISEQTKAAAERVSELESLTRMVAQTRAEAERAVRVRPASEANVRLEELADAAQRHGATIAQIASLTPDTRERRATIVPIKVAGRATYTQATALLRDVNENFRDMGVTAFKVWGTPQSGAAPVIEFSLDLAWYAAPAGAGGGAGRAGNAEGAAGKSGAGSAGSAVSAGAEAKPR